jgi:hypothetical protein
MQLHKWLLAGVALPLTLCAPRAAAQYAPTVEDLVSRPGSRGPSTYMGGRYTRGDYRPLETVRSDVALLGQQGVQFRGRTQTSRYNRALQMAQLGVRGDAGFPGAWIFLGAGVADASRISGLEASQNLNLPLPGVPVGYVPALTAGLYTPRPPTSRFEDLLGLLPGESKPRQPVDWTMSEALASRNEERARLAEQEGLSLFKQATVEMRDPRTERYKDCLDCPDKLAQAVQRLRMVRDLDPQAYVPLVLMGHAALEQEQPMQATNYILQAFHRRPQLFSEQAEPIDRYFGDAQESDGHSAYLAAQLRRYARIGQLNPEMAAARALQAYCAWRLGDYRQAREAVDQLEALAAADEKRDEDLLNFAAALRLALP